MQENIVKAVIILTAYQTHYAYVVSTPTAIKYTESEMMENFHSMKVKFTIPIFSIPTSLSQMHVRFLLGN